MKYILIGLVLLVMFGLVGHIEQHDEHLMQTDTSQQFDPHQLQN